MTVNLKLLAAQIIGMFVIFAASLFLAAGTVWSKTRIAGTLIPRVARNLLRSSLNGFGTSD